MAVISESIKIKNITVQNTMEFGGWLPRMVKYYKGTKYEFFFCYYHKLNYGTHYYSHYIVIIIVIVIISLAICTRRSLKILRKKVMQHFKRVPYDYDSVL